MELGYQFANSLEMGLAGNLPLPSNDDISSQQFYYEYSTDYLFTPSLAPTTQASSLYSVDAANNFHLAVSDQQVALYPPTYATNFQPNSIESDALQSSVFLSPQTSAPSSAAQSPQAEPKKHELFDLSLDEIFDVDDILNNEQLITDELLDVLNDVGCSELLNQLDYANQTSDNETCCTSDSSVSSTPKRKYSTDSSDCYSVDSFETCSTDVKKAKRVRRSKANREERVARKKDQNKKAASRYRDKKKNEMQSSEQILDELESQRDGLSEQIKKLQTEFNVILPLAKAAFTFDPIRSEHLNQLISRINSLL